MVTIHRFFRAAVVYGLGVALCLPAANARTQDPSLLAPSSKWKEAQEAAEKIQAEKKKVAPLRILVVDDDEDLAMMLSLVLKKAGYQVVVAYDGKEGLEKATQKKFDLIISDFNMPGMTGDVMARRIKETQPDIPIILASGLAKKNFEQLEEGVADVKLSKPFKPEELLAHIKELTAKAPEQAAPALQAPPIRILLVEDEDDITLVAGRALQKAGYFVDVASSGEVGLKKALEGDFDMVITDLNMGEMRGDQMAWRIKREKPDLPIILWSNVNKVFRDQMADTQFSSADKVFDKPDDVLQFIPKLSEHVQELVAEARKPDLGRKISRMSHVAEAERKALAADWPAYEKALARVNPGGKPIVMADSSKNAASQLPALREAGIIFLPGDFRDTWRFAQEIRRDAPELLEKIYVPSGPQFQTIPRAFAAALPKDRDELPLARWDRFDKVLEDIVVTIHRPLSDVDYDLILVEATLHGERLLELMRKPSPKEATESVVPNTATILEVNRSAEAKTIEVLGLEVEKEYRALGIGRKILQTMREQLSGAYPGYRWIVNPAPVSERILFVTQMQKEGLLDEVHITLPSVDWLMAEERLNAGAQDLVALLDTLWVTYPRLDEMAALLGQTTRRMQLESPGRRASWKKVLEGFAAGSEEKKALAGELIAAPIPMPEVQSQDGFSGWKDMDLPGRYKPSHLIWKDAFAVSAADTVLRPFLEMFQKNTDEATFRSLGDGFTMTPWPMSREKTMAIFGKARDPEVKTWVLSHNRSPIAVVSGIGKEARLTLAPITPKTLEACKTFLAGLDPARVEEKEPFVRYASGPFGFSDIPLFPGVPAPDSAVSNAFLLPVLDEIRKDAKPGPKILVLFSRDGSTPVKLAKEFPGIRVYAEDDPMALAGMNALARNEGVGGMVKDTAGREKEKYDYIVMNAVVSEDPAMGRDRATVDPGGKAMADILDGFFERLEEEGTVFMITDSPLWMQNQAVLRGLTSHRMEAVYMDRFAILRVERHTAQADLQRIREVYRATVLSLLERLWSKNSTGLKLSLEIPVKEGARILDLAPGRGELSLSLAALKDARVQVPQTEKGMPLLYERGRQNLREYGNILSQHVTGISENPDDMDLADFDLVHWDVPSTENPPMEELLRLRARMRPDAILAVSQAGLLGSNAPAHWEDILDNVKIAIPDGAAGFVAPARTPVILVVDDSRTIGTKTAALLEQSGYKTIVAKHGPEGLQKAQTEPIDLVLSDFIMPEMNGDEMVREIRQAYPKVRAIIMSGEKENEKASLAVADAFWSKQESNEKLFALVEQQVGKPTPEKTFGANISRQDAVWEMLQALRLDDPRKAGCEVLEIKNLPSGAGLVTIRIPTPEDVKYPQGLDILFRQLAPTREFHLLYNPAGRLIAVLPVLSKATRERLKALDDRTVQYFDFSPYYFQVPGLGDPQAAEKWAEFSRQWQEDKQEIYRNLPLIYERVGPAFPEPIYKLQDGSPEQDIFTTEYGLLKSVAFEHKPYVYIQTVRREPGKPGEMLSPEITLFSPDEFDAEKFKADPGMHQAIFPAYPTVYPPYDPVSFARPRSLSDYLYYSAVYPGWNSPKLPTQPSVLVLGPAIGADSWLAWLRTGAKIHAAGLNPLEIANAKASARIVGFPLDARLHDNIVTEQMEPAFPGLAWDWVIWNMPSYSRPQTTLAPGAILSYDQVWDNDVGGVVLKRFLEGLKKTMRPGGHSIVWNDYSGFRTAEELPRWDVPEIMDAAGINHQDFPLSGYAVSILTVPPRTPKTPSALEEELAGKINGMPLPAAARETMLQNLPDYVDVLQGLGLGLDRVELVNVFSWKQEKDDGARKANLERKMEDFRRAGPILLAGNFKDTWNFAREVNERDPEIGKKLVLIEDLIEDDRLPDFSQAVPPRYVSELPLVLWHRYWNALQAMRVETHASPEDKSTLLVSARLGTREILGDMHSGVVRKRALWDGKGYFYDIDKLELPQDYQGMGLGETIVKKLSQKYGAANLTVLHVKNTEQAEGFWWSMLRKGYVLGVGIRGTWHEFSPVHPVDSAA